MRYLAATALLAGLGLLSGAAVAELSAAQVPTLPITTALPPLTVTVPLPLPSLPVTTATPPVTVTTPPVTVTVPPVTVRVPPVTTVTVPPVTVAVPPVTVRTPVTTVTTPTATATVPSTTTPAISTTSRPPTSAPGTPSGTAPRPDTAPGGGGGPASAGTVGGGASGATGGEDAVSSPSPFSASGAGPPPAAITSLRSSRPAIVASGPKARQAIVLRFRLDRPRRVRVGVMQVAPVCRFVGSFTIGGRSGPNALRFDRRFQGRRLPAGTYELRLRSPGVATRRLRLVISDSARLSPAALATAKQRNVCAAAPVYVEGLQTSIFGPPRFLSPGSVNGGGASSERVPSEGAVLSAVYQGNDGDGFDFTSSTAGRLTEEVSQSVLGRWLLGLALLLLVIAAFPRRVVPAPRLGHVVATRRVELAAVGASLFVGVLVVLGLA